MSDTITNQYEVIYQMSLTMLKMARESEWEGFVELAEKYIITLQQTLSDHPEVLQKSAEGRIGYIIKALVDNEAEISRNLKGRLDVLQSDITSLNRGRKCNQAYASSFTTTLQ